MKTVKSERDNSWKEKEVQSETDASTVGRP